MTSNLTNSLTRIAGFAITVILIVQPWLIKVNYIDPFFYSEWMGIIAGFLSLSVCSLLLAFYRPLKGYNNLTWTLLLTFIAIAVSLYYTHYTVSFRISMIYIGLLACIGSLRLLRKNKDNFSIAAMISLSGLFMSIYAICQATGHDFLIWGSKFNVVGTLTNPNYLGIFLCLTSAITFGLFSELYKKSLKDSLVFLVFFIVQIGVIIMLNRIGNYLCLAFMMLIWIWSNWFNISGKISRKSPLIAGFIIALILFLGQWYIYSKTSSYQWDKITFLPAKSHPFVTRVILWQMGFEIFKEHPETGIGAGSISYLMPLKRPPTASSLGLALHNTDPHSFIITTLAETGFCGLWGVCSILAAVFGIFLRKYSRYESVETNTDEEKPNMISFPWLPLLTAIVVIYLGFQAGFINQNYLPAVRSVIILAFGLYTRFLNNSYYSNKNDYLYIGKSTLTAILAFAFYSLFNNSFSIIPLIGLIVSIIGLHFSCCLPDVIYKPRITLISLSFIFLPVIYGFSSCHFQHSYNQEQLLLNLGTAAFEKEKWEEAEKYFFNAANINPQCLKAYHGRALALDAMGKTEEAQEVLSQLDAMVPNIFNVKYEIARILFENHKILEAHRYAVNNLKWIETPLAYELFGRILLEEGRYAEAEEVFKEGLINIPNNQIEIIAADRIRLNLAALNCNRANYSQCKKYLSEIKTEISEHLEYLYMKGLILTEEKRYDEALEIFEKALKSYSNVPKILNAVGYLLMITDKDLDRAEVILEEAYKIVKENQPVNLSDLLMISNSLGKLYQKQNKLSQAGELLKYSYEETPDEWKSLKETRLKDLNDFYNSFGKAE